jgi:glycosyltransferase involved in cell wall biosynthesis
VLKLSILICTLKNREIGARCLFESLIGQMSNYGIVHAIDRKGGLRTCANKIIEIISCLDDGELSIGAKRQLLLERAKGDYICFVDDDDEVPEYYIEEILRTIETEPDCVGFWGTIVSTRNGAAKKVHYSLHNKQLRHDMGKDIFLRGIGHLSPVKRSIAMQVGFVDKSHGEDRIYSEGITPLIETEVFIDKAMYTYKTSGNI